MNLTNLATNTHVQFCVSGFMCFGPALKMNPNGTEAEMWGSPIGRPNPTIRLETNTRAPRASAETGRDTANRQHLTGCMLASFWQMPSFGGFPSPLCEEVCFVAQNTPQGTPPVLALFSLPQRGGRSDTNFRIGWKNGSNFVSNGNATRPRKTLTICRDGLHVRLHRHLGPYSTPNRHLYLLLQT